MRSARPSTCGQIQLAVVKGAAGELAGLGETAPGLPAERGQHGFDDGRSAVQVEFGHVLAGLGARRGEPQHQRLIERLAVVRIADAAQGGEALLGPRRRQRIDEIAGAGPETRTTATPARPGALDRAKMVGASAIRLD